MKRTRALCISFFFGQCKINYYKAIGCEQNCCGGYPAADCILSEMQSETMVRDNVKLLCKYLNLNYNEKEATREDIILEKKRKENLRKLY